MASYYDDYKTSDASQFLLFHFHLLQLDRCCKDDSKFNESCLLKAMNSNLSRQNSICFWPLSALFPSVLAAAGTLALSLSIDYQQNTIVSFDERKFLASLRCINYFLANKSRVFSVEGNSAVDSLTVKVWTDIFSPKLTLIASKRNIVTPISIKWFTILLLTFSLPWLWPGSSLSLKFGMKQNS